MISAVVAHRYAQAIYQAGVDAGQTEQVYTQLQFFAALLEQNVRLRELIMGKSLAAAQKKELIATIFANEKLPLVKHLLFILVDKGRETLLPDIIALYHQYQEQAAGRVEAQLVSVRPLTQAQISAVAQALGKKRHQQVVFTTHIDENLIAGCKIIVGDEVIDGSVRHQLETLLHQLVK